ncbi:unnamed protein product, partial [Musa textilis]
RAPPPSPIATGKGLRSAAVDDLVLTEYLEDSLRVPDLNLPESYFPSRSPLKALAEVEIHSLVSGDGFAVRQVLAAAAEIGAVHVAGGGAPLAEEARAAIEACGVVFEAPEGGRVRARWGSSVSGGGMRSARSSIGIGRGAPRWSSFSSGPGPTRIGPS